MNILISKLIFPFDLSPIAGIKSEQTDSHEPVCSGCLNLKPMTSSLRDKYNHNPDKMYKKEEKSK